MVYIGVSDIQRELGLEFSETSKPTAAEVQEIIDQVEAELNGFVASLGYSVPVTDGQGAKILAQAALWGACSRVIAAYAGATANANPRETTYWERYRDFIDRLLANPGILHGANRASGLSGAGGDPVFTIRDKF